MKNRHTPVPWKVSKIGYSVSLKPALSIIGQSANWIAQLPACEETNAHYIVKCVNMHDELLEACKMAEDTIRRKEYVVHEGVKHLRAIREAIAKAEEV